MPVNELQQAICRVLIGLGGMGGKLWLAAGAVLAAALLGLALAPFLSAEIRQRIRGRLGGGVLLSDAFFLCIALGALVVLRLPGLSRLELNPDEGGLILGARTLLHDPRFWLSFENTTLGPVSTFSITLVGALGFPIDYTSIKALGIAIWCAVALLMFLGFRRLYGAGQARLFVLPLVLVAATFTLKDYVAFNGEHMAVLLLAAAFWLHAGLLRDRERTLPGRAFLLGTVLALVPFAKIQPGPIAFAWGALACAFALARQRARLAYLCAGAALPLVLLAAYLGWAGVWRDFWESYILNNLLYAAEGWNATQREVTFLGNAAEFPKYLLTPWDTRGFFVFGAMVAGAAVVWAGVSEGMRRRLGNAEVLLGAVLSAAAAICVLMPKNNWTHYLLLLLVPVSILVAAVVAQMLRAASEREADIRIDCRNPDWQMRLRGDAFIAVLVGVFGGLLPATYVMVHGNPAWAEARENLETGRTPGAVAEAILRYARPGEPVAHWGVQFAPMVDAGVSLGTRDAHIERALYPSRQQDYYLHRWTMDLEARRPHVLVDSCEGQFFEKFRLERFPREWEHVTKLYRRVEEVKGYQLYVLKGAEG